MRRCKMCGKELPDDAFYGTCRTKTCKQCHTEKVKAYRKANKIKAMELRVQIMKKEYEEKKKREAFIFESKEVKTTCKDNCLRYPCFQGIDNIKSNLSLTCIKFKQK